MKKFVIMILALFLFGCNASEKKEVTQDSSPIKTSQTEMQKVSSVLITNFMKDLKAELMQGISEGGLTNAISACQTKAPEIADNFTSEFWSIKRVTNQPRNQENKVDSHEQEILALFADTLTKLEFFDEWKDLENNKDYYFYKPIYMGKFCLKCHGTTSDISEDVAVALREKYSDDKAIGYSEGDLRGMFVIQIRSKAYSDTLMQSLTESPE